MRVVTTRHPGRVALLGATAFAALTWLEFAFRVVGPALSAPHWPSPGYWVAGRLVLEGRLDLLYAEAPAFGAEAVRLGTVPDIFHTNSPLTILPLLPFALLPETLAHAAWLVLGIAALVLAWWALVRRLDPPPVGALLATALLPLFEPIRENVELGQAYLVLLALFVAAALHGERRSGRGSAIGAVSLATAGLLKLYYALVVAAAWAVSATTRRGAAAAGVMVAVAAAVTVAAWGVGPWIAAAEAAAAWRTRPETTVTAYQTLNGFLGHLLRFDSTWNPSPVIDAPWLVTPIWLVGAGVVAAVTLLVSRRAGAQLGASRGMALAPSAIALLAGLLLAPVAEDHHFALAVLPLAASGSLLATGRRGGAGRLAWPAWAVAAGLLGGPWAFEVAGVEGWAAVALYPRLYGAALLWGLIAWMVLGREADTAASARRDDGRSKGA